jgi:integrase
VAAPRRRRENNEGSIHFWTKRGLWRGYVSVGGGRRKYVYGKTREEAREKLKAALRAQSDGTLVVGPRHTLNQYLAVWLRDTVQPTVRPWTYKGYEVLVRVHIAPELGNVVLDKLTPQHVQALMNRKLEAGMAPKTVQYMRGVLRTALEQALRWGLVSRNVAALVDGPRVERSTHSVLDAEMARVLVEAAPSDRLGALYVVTLALGLRQGEALGLRWEDVDFEGGLLHVRHQLQRVSGSAELVPPKTARSRRTLPMPALVAEALRAHEGRQAEERESAARWHETGFVFTSVIGTPLDGPNVTKAFQRFLERCGLPRMRFHDLRHSCATLLLARRDVSHRMVMELLGHSQIALTMNTYTQVLPELKRETARGMDAILRPNGGTEGGTKVARRKRRPRGRAS